MKTDRKLWVDVLKGLAIYSVILGHCIQYIYCCDVEPERNVIFLVIYSFHMALFAMISGYLHYSFQGRYDIKTGIIRKTQTILVPCVLWGMIQYAYTVFRGWNGLSIKELFYYLISHNWFLWAIFYCSIVVILSSCLDVYLIGIIVIVLSFFFPDWLNLIYFKMMFPSFLLGYLLADKRVIEKVCNLPRSKKSLCIIVGWFLYAVLMLFFINKEDVMAWTYYGFGQDRGIVIHLLKRLLINAVGAVTAMITASAVWCDAEGKVLVILARLGKISLGIYMVQGIIFGFGQGLLFRISVGDTIAKTMITFVASVVITVISSIVVWGMGKNKLASKLLLGRA